jgi:hypothetical protein
MRAGRVGDVDRESGNGDDPARLWRGLAIWPLIAGGAGVLVASVSPGDVGPTVSGWSTFWLLGGTIIVVSVVVGCFGVANTSQSTAERWLFGIAGVATIAFIGAILLMAWVLSEVG